MSDPAKDPFAVLLDVQQQIAELVRTGKRERAKTLRRRGKQVAYSPGELPGPKPTELDIARAKRLWRRV